MTALLGALLFFVPFAVLAQTEADYPSRPVKVVVPAAPGGAPDVVVRAISQRIAGKWGQQFVVDNRPGATGSIGVDAVLQAPADGYTLLMAWEGVMAINPLLFPQIRYVPLRDFAPITLAARVNLVLVAHPSFPPSTIEELVAYAKERPGTINYASAGNGQLHHLSMELLKHETGIQLVHIPYKGGPAALQDVVAGQVPLTFIGLTPAIPLLKAGRLKAFGVTGRQRASQLPDVPAVAEKVPGFTVDGAWLGFFAPVAVSPGLVSRLSRDINEVLSSPELQRSLFAVGMKAEGTSPAEFAQIVRAETERYRRIIDAAKISAR